MRPVWYGASVRIAGNAEGLSGNKKSSRLGRLLDFVISPQGKAELSERYRQILLKEDEPIDFGGNSHFQKPIYPTATLQANINFILARLIHPLCAIPSKSLSKSFFRAGIVLSS
jgi:hypothetical protein